MIDEYKKIEALNQRHLQSPMGWNFDCTQNVKHNGVVYPLWKITCGNQNADAVTLILTGGVHGLERIGSQLCISFLEKYFALNQWDPVLQEQLKSLRIVFLPIVNPVGVHLRSRCNGNGVDLMRNAPLEATDSTPFLVGGHRYSNKLPWFRGLESAPMEVESQFLIDQVLIETKNSKAVIALDFHSGFGLRDQIWFPWAFAKKPFPRLDLMQLMSEFFENLYPDHIYKIQPQSQVYCTNGDLWDYLLHDQIKNSHFLPITLELGSWLWIKKNPFQILRSSGIFNPIKKHRLKRTLRRHQALVDFLTRFLLFMKTTEYSKTDFIKYYNTGLKRWYF